MSASGHQRHFEGGLVTARFAFNSRRIAVPEQTTFRANDRHARLGKLIGYSSKPSQWEKVSSARERHWAFPPLVLCEGVTETRFKLSILPPAVRL